MEIRCRKTDCSYNTGASCKAAKINVANGCCQTYAKNDLKQALIIENGNLFEISEELVAKNVRNVPLSCQQKNCLYHRKDCSCSAHGITVIDGELEDGDTVCSKNAECATFVPS